MKVSEDCFVLRGH